MEKIKNQDCLAALQAASDKECYREVWRQPFLQGDYACAGDGHHILLIPVDVFDNVHETELLERSAPNVSTLFPKGEEGYKDVLITLELLDNTCDVIPKVPVYGFKKGKCPECGGSGEVTWEYKSKDGIGYEMDGECPICDGTGCQEWKDKEKLHYENNYRWPISVLDKAVMSKEIFLLQRIMRTLLLSHIRIKWISPKNNHIFCESDNGIIFMVMPLYTDDCADNDRYFIDHEYKKCVRLV